MVAALLASEDKSASPHNPRALGAEGEGGRGAVPPQRDKQQRVKYNLGSSLQEADQVKVLKMLEDSRGDTATPGVTYAERSVRLGRALDGHVMRWLGAMLHAS